MISVPADIAGQSKHAADWLDGRKEQGPSPVLARAKRQMEELEVDWADAFAVPETESVTVPRPKKKRTGITPGSQQPPATYHQPSPPPTPLSPPTRLERSLPRRLPTSSCWHRRHRESNARRNRPRRKRTKQRRRRRKRRKRGRRRRRKRRKRGRRRRRKRKRGGRRRRRKRRRRDGRKQRRRKQKR